MTKTALILGATAFILSACATATTAPTAPVSTTTTTKILPPGYIAQCRHDGAPTAQLSYPEDWQDRLDRVIDGSPGDELMGGPQVNAVQAPNAQPISPPIPEYPNISMESNLEARCEVLFDIGLDGKTRDLLTACSSPEFISSARNAIQPVRFSSKSLDGRPVERWNVIYPLVFCLAE